MSSDEAAAEFISFAKLPTELRIEIWNYAARTPNIIELKVERYPIYHRQKPRRETSKRSRSAVFTWGYQISSSSPLRGVLFACKESRLESLKSDPSYLKLKNKTTKIYFLPSIDIISMDSSSHFTLMELGRSRGLGISRATGFKDIQSMLLPEGYGTTAGVGSMLRYFLSAVREVTVGFMDPDPSTELEMKRELAGSLTNSSRKNIIAVGEAALLNIFSYTWVGRFMDF